MSEFEHGLNGYTYHRCRCDVCLAASRAYARQWSAARMAERVLRDGRMFSPTALRHGEVNTYNRYGCRCEPCTTAHREARRDYLARRRAS